MENASEGTHSNKNSLSISGEESAGLSASPPLTLKMFRQKETSINYYAAIILNTYMWQTYISGKNLRLLHSKMFWINYKLHL